LIPDPIISLAQAYKASSAVTHETISSVRTINAIAAHTEMLAVCQELVSEAGRGAVGVAFAAGIGHGFTYLVQFCLYFTAFVAGARLMVWNGYGFDDVIKVFLSIAFAGIAAQLVGIRVADLAKARAALSRLFALSDLSHCRDQVAAAEHPAPPDSISGSLELRNVVFSYPSRPSATVLSGINITFPAGKTVALVGSSGSGKSTVIQLIERFYDPISGSVTLDGRDLSSFPLKWLRTQMSLVSQEPVLFYESVSDSIRRGKRGLECSQEEVIEAAIKANAHNFVSSLPKVRADFVVVCTRSDRGLFSPPRSISTQNARPIKQAPNPKLSKLLTRQFLGDGVGATLFALTLCDRNQPSKTAGIRHNVWGEGIADERRAEAAHRHCAGRGVEPAHPASRRGDVCPRHGERAPRPGTWQGNCSIQSNAEINSNQTRTVFGWTCCSAISQEIEETNAQQAHAHRLTHSLPHTGIYKHIRDIHVYIFTYTNTHAHHALTILA
jgi:ABC-type sugar transport system ATPase subunit